MEAGLPVPHGLCCTSATIWYVFVIDVLRSVARTRRLISNVLNSLSEDDFYTSCKQICAAIGVKAGSSKNSNTTGVGNIPNAIICVGTSHS